jgi:cell wall-associated NlpC family hydrolase
MSLTNEQREAIVSEAESWVGTPYRGWSCVKGTNGGVDCGQLLYGVYHNAGLVPAIELPKDYPLYIGQHQASTAYVDLVENYFREITEAEVLPGDVVVWKLPLSLAFCHAAIIKSWPTYFIHSLGSGVKAGDARSRLAFRKAERKFYTLKDSFCG